MLPIKDTIRAQSFPLVNWLLIIANAVVWFFMIDMTPGELEGFVFTYGLVPAQIDLFNPSRSTPSSPTCSCMGVAAFPIEYLDPVHLRRQRRRPAGLLPLPVLLPAGRYGCRELQTYMNPGSTYPRHRRLGRHCRCDGSLFPVLPARPGHYPGPLFFFPWFVELPAIVSWASGSSRSCIQASGAYNGFRAGCRRDRLVGAYRWFRLRPGFRTAPHLPPPPATPPLSG
jgi:hypothetical protein